MKEYIDQIFYEGLGYSLYVPIENKIKKINNKKLNKIIINTYKVVYIVFSIILTLIILYVKIS